MTAPTLPHGTSVANPLETVSGAKHGVGARTPKVDGFAKATGATKYTDDLWFPNMLHARIKRATRAHARITAVDVSSAAAMTGVRKVITGQDIPGLYGVIPWTRDEEVLCADKVRHIGDGLAAVAADTEEQAMAAVRAITVTYQDLPAVLDVETAARTGDTPDTKVNEAARKGNLTKLVDLSFGNVTDGLEQSTTVVDQVFQFHGTTHAAIEPHCAIADWQPGGAGGGLLTVWSATQVPHYLHRELARILGMAENQIRVIQPAVGGAFGGKSEPFDLEFVVARLAVLTGQPVKCLYTREEVFYAHRGRHPMRMHFQVGADDTGHLKAVRSEIDIDGGAYASFGMITAFYAGQLLTGPVGFDTYAFKARRYYTNKPACGPKRGHGSVQPRFAFEVSLDMLAHKLGMDPMDIRRKNFSGENTTLVNGQRVGSQGLLECLGAVEQASDWKLRRGKLPQGRGLGVATSMYISGTNYPVYPNEMPQSGVQVRLDRSGRVTLLCGASDIGQGSDSMLAAVVHEELGVLPGAVRVLSGDSDLCAVDLGAYSSRITLMAGHAAQEACRSLRQRIQTAVAAHWTKEGHAAAPDDVMLADGKAWLRRDTAVSLTAAEAFCVAEAHHGTLSAAGSYRTVPRGGDYRGGTIGASPAYSVTAHVAEVEVDPQTGRVVVRHIWCAHDCGKAFNPTLVEGQIEGSCAMGLGEVFLENMLYGEDPARQGMLVGPSLLDYRMPTSVDTPDITALLVEKPDPNGPYGAKEAGEGPLHGVIPAIANAIFDAVGVRLFELPFTPARIRQALANTRHPTTAKAG